MRNKSIGLCLTAILVIFSVNAQSRKLEKANSSFGDYNYDKAIHQYEALVVDGITSREIYQNLGDANYFNANYAVAAKWYAKVVESNVDALDIEQQYRYLNTLQSIGDVERSTDLLKKLDKSGFVNIPKVENLKKDLMERSGSYTIEPMPFNSTASDFAPSFHRDGLVFSTARDTNGISKNIHSWNKKRFLNLYFTSNSADGNFKNALRLSDKLNSKLHESSTAFTKDGKTVYFTRNKEKGKGFGRDQEGISRLKLYRAVFKNGTWQNVQALAFNKEGYSVAHPALNKAEDKLYFTADIEGTEGQSDIFVVSIHSDGSFGTPKNLGGRINTRGRETFPFVSDDDVLYFASDGHLGLGGLDIFAVDLKNTETSKIVNLGEPLNSIADDFSLILNSETKKGFFASNRKGGMGDDDIYALSEIKPIETRCFFDLEGIVKDGVTGKVIENSAITLLSQNGSVLADSKSDIEGRFTLQVACDQIDYITTASKETYVPTRKYTSSQGSEASYLTFLLDPIDTGAPAGTDLAKYLNIKPIYFNLNRSNIRKDAEVVFEKILKYLNTYPEAKIEVRSHTDSRASTIYNKALSERRAKETVAYLISKGIAPQRIAASGFGESQLTNNCSDTQKCSEEEHQRNRRSEFIVVD